LTTIPPGAATLDAADLQARVEACIDEVLQHPQAREIHAVGMATLVGNVVGVNGTGEAITPIYTYADTRSAEDVELLRSLIDPEETHQRTGCVNHTAYLPGRLHWLRRTESDLFKRAAQWVDVGTYLYRQWFGRAACSYSVAAWTGMLDRIELAWNRHWLNILQLDEACFPYLADYDEVQGGLRQPYAQRWAALREVPFCLAVGDGAAANVGAGCVDASQIALTLGTTAALRVASRVPPPTIPAGLWGYRITRDLHLIGGATTEGGNIFRWIKDTLAFGDADFEKDLAERPADAHGMTILPLFAGERSPGWAANATGAIVGLRLSTTPLDIAQAALESVALRLAFIAEQLHEIVSDDAPVISGGGALEASPVWAQMIANALNRTLHITAEPELTARGTAILALQATGQGALADYPPQIARTIMPQPEGVAALRAARERQQRLYRRLIAEDWQKK
jgi:gluconokinase